MADLRRMAKRTGKNGCAPVFSVSMLRFHPAPERNVRFLSGSRFFYGRGQPAIDGAVSQAAAEKKQPVRGKAVSEGGKKHGEALRH